MLIRLSLLVKVKESGGLIGRRCPETVGDMEPRIGGNPANRGQGNPHALKFLPERIKMRAGNRKTQLVVITRGEGKFLRLIREADVQRIR